ncbi:MAG: hypothetical protein ACRENI_11655 [Gemmatimonadaceae bacterium]
MARSIDRREFVRESAIAGIGLLRIPGCVTRPAVPPRVVARPASALVDPDSRFFATARVETFSPVDTDSGGDLWPSCWAGDGYLYTANGDGRGFGPPSGDSDTVVSRISGTPETGLTGEAISRGEAVANVWGEGYNRKPTGMLAVDGDGDGQDELYIAVQNLNARPCPACFNDAPTASISKSLDHGRTWRKTDAPMFTDYRFTTIFFLDYGQSGRNVGVLGPEGARYVYAYGLDHNWRSPTDPDRARPTDLYLARVPRDRILERAAWEFFAGLGAGGQPTWSPDLERRQAAFHDERTVYPELHCGGRPQGDTATSVGVISQGSVVYNAPLDRYIYTSWTWYTWEFYEAPQPWGPWQLFLRKDFGAQPYLGESDHPTCPDRNEGGYCTTIPSKFISADGRTMWVQSDSWERWVYACGTQNYNFSLRKLTVEPFVATEATNRPDPTDNLARTGEGVTPIEKSAVRGRVSCYNDGERTPSESSEDCDARKPLDFWGYTWTRRYNLDRVAYTTGHVTPDGGWFDSVGGGLRVQVRQDFRWVDVAELAITPAYPYDWRAGPEKRYELTFRSTWGDGVRIVGPPGGVARYTTIAELEVYYAG